MSQWRMWAYISSTDAVLPKAQLRDKTVFKEDILGTYPPL